MEKFKCLPKKEPFCCFTERLTLLPSEVRKFKKAIENYGVLIPSFRGFWDCKQVKSQLKDYEGYAFISLTKKTCAYVELEFIPLKAYTKSVSREFKEYLSKYELNPPYVCPFLDEKTFRCSIYEERPLCCRRYPALVNATFEKEQCIACSNGKAFCQNCDGKTVEELLSPYKTEEFKKERKEFHNLIKTAFSYSNVLNEAIKVLKSMNFMVPPSPNFFLVIHHLTFFIYQNFDLSLEKQLANLENALRVQKGKEPAMELSLNLRSLKEVKKVKNLGKKLPEYMVKVKLDNLPIPGSLPKT